MMPGMRTRKLSLDHHSNRLLMDNNGNNRQFQRLSSLSEMSIEEPNETLQYEESSESCQTSPPLDNSVLKQLQSLIKNVQISESLAEYINREVLGCSDVNANTENRKRRKSCFTLSNTLGNIAEQTNLKTRRQSVASKASSLTRRKASNAGLNDNICSSIAFQHSQQRRASIAYANTGRQNSTMTLPKSRRNSVHHFESPMLNNASGARKNSNAYVHMHRRSSIAHAYQNSAMPKLRRMSSVQDNIGGNSENIAPPQRRRSSIKPPCFPVTKIANVQKRLNRLYRRRKRNERAQVNIKDVKNAFKELRKDENASASESELANEQEDNCEENSDSWIDTSYTEQSIEETITVDTNSVNETPNENKQHDTAEISDEESFETAPGEVPAPRRKTSIQVRAWELSRKIRQRRREKRKGFTESVLI